MTIKICSRCKRAISRDREGCRRVGASNTKHVCDSCWREWMAVLDACWHNWLNPPKEQKPRGLSAAKQLGITQ